MKRFLTTDDALANAKSWTTGDPAKVGWYRTHTIAEKKYFFQSNTENNTEEPSLAEGGKWDMIGSPVPDLSALATIQYVDDQDAALSDQIDSAHELAETANNGLTTKVDKAAGYGLSQQNFTSSEKTKLATLSEHFKGQYTSLSALTTANPVGSLGDYANVDPGPGQDNKMYIWDANDSKWILSSGSIIPDGTETSSGLLELATIAEALARTDDQRAMTALKTIALILDEKKKFSFMTNAVGLNEVSFLAENAGQILSSIISGASSLKIRIGSGGTYPTGAQTYPVAYAAASRIYVTYNYDDLMNATCNLILKAKDN